MRVSVVVPTFQRPDMLDRCLAALTAQDLDPADYEIVVADDSASDATRRQVEEWAGRASSSVRYLPVHGAHGPAAARNLGWCAARGSIIAFTDDDCIPDARWLKAGLVAFTPGVAAVTGRVIVPLPAEPTDYERDAAGLEAGEFVTANCFVRREILEVLRGFDERFSAAWREDSDLHFRVLALGGPIVPAPSAVVVHPVRPARWGVSLKQQKKSQFNALLYKKHPWLYRQRIRAWPPWNYYAMLLALVLALALWAAGQPRLLMIALTTWGLLTLQFCRRRLARTSRAPGHVIEMIVTSALIPPLSVFWRLYGAVRFRVLFL